MHERILLMGGPGTGKTHHIVSVCNWLAESGKEMWVLDLEDKMEAFLHNQGGIPKNMHLAIALSWEEIRGVIDSWTGKIKENNWVVVDRVDLSWSMAQHWYSQQRFNEELADRLLRSAKSVTGSAMMIPRFPEGAWQVINMNYDYFISRIMYLFRCHVLLTAGVSAPREEGPHPFETFSSVGVTPRGQKELAHQPNTVFLLSSVVERNRQGNVTSRSWNYTTAKDLPGREYVDNEPLLDFSIQYLERYNI